MISKTDLRKQLIEKRKKLDTKVLSELICEKITLHPTYIKAKTIFAYYPKPYEVDISPLFKDKNKTWFLPKTTEDNLVFYEYKHEDELIIGNFNVFEPKHTNPTKIIPDLIIVPALSINENNIRLGYGKGYYDRFLSNFKNPPKTLTPIFSALLTNDMPVENHDKKIDFVINEFS